MNCSNSKNKDVFQTNNFVNNKEHIDTHIKPLDLRGQLCPYPVSNTISILDDLQKGTKLVVLVDDPLAIKAIPEELENDDIESITITKNSKYWQIEIIK